MKSRIGILLLLTAAAVSSGPCVKAARADYTYGGESQVQSFFDGTSGFLVKTVGTGIFIVGLIVAGIKIAAGDQNGLRNAALVIVGGAVIFLSKPLVNILAKMAGSQ